jgi:glucosyl-dolichyl phosphate glucuronosyltransferase
MLKSHLTCSVIICAYSSDRWSDLQAAVESVQRQSFAPAQIIVVIDHNPALLLRARNQLEGVTAISNDGPRGLSGDRNTGIRAAEAEIIAFLDDDAVADSTWIERLVAPFSDDKVIAVGGAIEPKWLGRKPGWFPDEFLWVVGCSYRGLRPSAGVIRNVIGANMAIRRDVFDVVGLFRSEVGRVEANPVGCEETELCIRAQHHWPQRVVWFQPDARVSHKVTKNRSTFAYFRKRCYAEGRSKALVAGMVGAEAGLSAERSYTTRVLPTGAVRGLRDVLRGDASGMGRAVTIALGLGITTFGYLSGRVAARSGSTVPVPAQNVAASIQ